MNNTFEEIWEALMKAESVLIPLHRSPDADSLGSAIASALVLHERGKKVHVISTDEPPDFESLLQLCPVDIEKIDPAFLDLSAYDVLLIQDNASAERFSKEDNFALPSHATVVNIDHHVTNTYFGTFNYVDAGIPATAGILYELFNTNGVTITQDMALALYFGMVTDTGWFAYGVPPRTHEIAAKLVAAGADSRTVKLDLEKTTLNKIKYNGIVSSRLEYIAQARCVFSSISYQEIEALDLVGVQVYSIVQQLKNIVEPEIDFACVVTEKEPGVFSMSLRSRENSGFDVSVIAERLGGGGHKPAAGAIVKADNVDEVRQKLLEAVVS